MFIDRLQLRSGAFEFQDQARSTPFRARLTPVEFELLDFGTTGGTDNRYSLQARSTAGEHFSWSGSFGFSPLSSRGSFELGEVQARTLWSYLQESLGFEIAGGVVNVSGGYDVAATEPQLTAAPTLAKIDVSGLGVRPRGGEEDWIHLDSVAMESARLDHLEGIRQPAGGCRHFALQTTGQCVRRRRGSEPHRFRSRQRGTGRGGGRQARGAHARASRAAVTLPRGPVHLFP